MRTFLRRLLPPLVALGLGSLLVLPLSAQGSLSSQVLRLLSRENEWTALQTFDKAVGLRLESAAAPLAVTTDKLENRGGNLYWNNGLIGVAPGGVGTVTSVGLSLPAIFSVAGSPVVAAGTLTATLATQTANRVWAGPSGGGAATPTFRALVDDDVPDTLTVDGAGNVTWASLDTTGSSLADLTTRSATDLTSGTLSPDRMTDNDGTAGIPWVSGGPGTPGYTALDLSSATSTSGLLKAAAFPVLTGDVTTAGGSLATTLATTGVVANTYTSATITVDAKGRITAASSNTVGAHNLLSATHTDTTAAAFGRGAVIVGSATAWAKVTPSVTGSILRYDGTDTAFSTDASALTALNATQLTSGTTAVARGGTGLGTTPTNGQLLIGNGTNYTLAALTGTANQVVVTNGVGTITLSTPQSIGTSSSVQFGKIGVGTGVDATALLKLAGSLTYGYVDNGNSGAAKTINWASGNYQTITLTNTPAALSVSNVVAGQSLRLRLVQDGTGSRTVTWWTTIKWKGGSAPTLTTTTGKTDVIECWATSTTTFDCDVQLNY